MTGILSAVVIKQKEFSDFEVLRCAVQDAPVDIVQLAKGKMTGSLAHLSLGTVGASTGHFALSLRSAGILSNRRLALATVLEAPATWLNFKAKPGDVLIIPPNHELYAHYHGANRYAVTFIDLDEATALMQAMEPAALDSNAWHEVMLFTDPRTATARTEKLKLLLATLQAHGPTMPVETVEFYKRSLVELKFEPIINGSTYRGPQLSSTALVREVNQVLFEAGPRPVHVSEICAALGRRKNALDYGFKQMHNMTLKQFLQRKRLGHAHTALLTAAPGDTVEAIAIRNGFPHGGRFSQLYALQFSEQPNETLRRLTPPGLRGTMQFYGRYR